jgi:iron(III) transport system permease protein
MALPLYQTVWRSLSDRTDRFVGLHNYASYFATPALAASFFNSLYVAGVTTAVSVVLGFVVAYALTRTAMPGKGFIRTIAMLPLYAPPLVLAIALIYLFGNKGLVTTGLFGLLPRLDVGIYGGTGIIVAEVLYCFPQALLILRVSLSLSDARLYDAATALHASPWRTFWTITLPSMKYGLASAIFVCFTLAFTDFGAPKVIGGNFNVLATDIYKQVVGQQNFVMGATVSMLLLFPSIAAFAVDRLVQRRQMALLTTRAVPLQPRPLPLYDRAYLTLCGLIALVILVVLGTALYASLVQIWPYNLGLTTQHYRFRGVGGGGYEAYWNSMRMSFYTAMFGTAIVFGSAYLLEKGHGLLWMRRIIYFLSMVPVALPGLVLGLSYIFFFNAPSWHVAGLTWSNPLHSLYGTMALLVMCNIIHFYTVCFLTATTALKQMDGELEAVAASLRVPFYKTFWRVTVPVCLPAILEIAAYFFVNAMATVSAVIFLYGPALKLASVAVVNMDDAGDTAAAAAMSMLIVGTSLIARGLYEVTTIGLRRRTQAWTRQQAG